MSDQDEKKTKTAEQVNDSSHDNEVDHIKRPIVLVDEVLPPYLPVLPLTDRPLFPRMMSPVIIPGQRNALRVKKMVNSPGGIIGLVLVREENDEDGDEDTDGKKALKDSLYNVGVAAKIMQINTAGRGETLSMVVKVLARFEIEKVFQRKEDIRVKVHYWHDSKVHLNDEIKSCSVALINSIRELVRLNPLFKEELSLLIGTKGMEDPGTLADFSASMTTASADELQDILETRNIPDRIEKALFLIRKELEISKTQLQINKRIEERMTKQQREFFLREQLKEIKKELGISKEDGEALEDKYLEKSQELKFTKEAMDRFDEELEKIRVLGPSSPEYNVSRTYLDWLTCLPWGKRSDDNFDLKHARVVLDEHHFGLQDVKDRILEFISVANMKGSLTGNIILLVGPPGVGKTSIGKSVAESLNRKFYRFSVGGMRDEAEIKGHRRTYIGAMPGKFIQALKTTETSNPVIMLDEIDKIGASYQGDPASALLEVLDPEQNKEFLDHYLDVRFDLSDVLFVCTANQLDTISGPLLDRMEIIELSGYIIEEKIEIAKRHLIPKLLKAHGLDDKQFIMATPVLRSLIDNYAREAGVRGLEKNIKKLMRKAVQRLVEDKKLKSVKITQENLKDYLGKEVFREEEFFADPLIGVVMGLAYTSYGGAVLHIEASSVATKRPGFKQTGQLGKVMIESSEIAYSYMRSKFGGDKKAKKMFEEQFVHLHVPAGATPKDGPSAGITMACALYSLIHEIPIKPNLAMTGELSLAGKVLPIGGVKEKTLAAKRADVKELIFPYANKEDFETLDKKIKEGLEVHFVKEFDEVMKIAFPQTNNSKKQAKKKQVKVQKKIVKKKVANKKTVKKKKAGTKRRS